MSRTAKVTRKGGSPRYIPDAFDYKGYLAQTVNVGEGKIIRTEYWTNGIDDAGEDPVYERYVDKYKCYFNASLIPDIDEFKNILKKKFGERFYIDDIIGTDLEKYLIRIGNNDDNLTVEFMETEEEKQARLEKEYFEKIENKEVCINFRSGHIFGLETCKLPYSLFSMIKKYGQYHDGGEEDQEWADDQDYFGISKENLRGWFFDDNAPQTLFDAGYKVSFNGIELSRKKDIKAAKEEYFSRKEKEQKDTHKKYMRISELKDRYFEFLRNSNTMTEKEVKDSDIENNYNRIIYPDLGITGHDIYGGGMYILLTEERIYFIQNNGMDGDDWSRNNFRTGGAGAIASYLEMTDEVKAWIIDAKEFQSKDEY